MTEGEKNWTVKSASDRHDGTVVNHEVGKTKASSESDFTANEPSFDVGTPPITTENDQPTTVEDIVIDEEKPNVPDGGWGWIIVLSAFLVHVLMGGFTRSSGVFYLQLKERFQTSATETSWVLALFSTLRLCMGPVASVLCNRFSCRTVVYIGALLSTVGVLMSAFTPNLQFLYFSFGIVSGVGRALAYCPSLIIVGYYFNKRRGIAVGLATSGVGIGGFLFPPTVEKMFEYFGFQGTFLILAAVTSHFLICGALFRPLELERKLMRNSKNKYKANRTAENYDSEKRLLNDCSTVILGTKDENLSNVQNIAKMASSMEITANAKIDAITPSLFKRKFSQVKLALTGTDTNNQDKKPLFELSLFKNYAFSVLCIQMFLFTLSYHATFVFLPALAGTRYLTPIQGAYLLSILGICDAVARIVMSFVLDLKRVKKYRLIIYNFVMIWVGMVSLVIPSMTTFWQFSIVSALYGFLSGTYISQKSVVVVDVLGVKKLSSSFGFLLLFQGLGSLIGPIVGALFKDFLGSYDMSFYFGSIGIFSGGLVLATGNIWLHLQRNKKGYDERIKKAKDEKDKK